MSAIRGTGGDLAARDRVARAGWSRVAEPGDPVAAAVIDALGAVEAWEWLQEAARCEGSLLVPVSGLSTGASARLARSVGGWSTRLGSADPHRDLAHLEALGGTLLVPGDERWPEALGDLGPAAPWCLWVVGGHDLRTMTSTAVSVIGARAASGYGEHVTAQLAGGLADAGRTVVSGGAFGIDAAAHRAALASQGCTVAVLAGGLDRPYPVGNARLLSAVAQAGALVSEVPPGSAPTRSRFLLRNRLIAALSRATVVVEAAWRSGALSTAGHAAALLRPVGAVPGPVTAATSAGCHRLLRDGRAVCVTDVAEVLELVGPLEVTSGPEDLVLLDGEARRVLDALPVRHGCTPAYLTRPAGLALPEVLACLGTLESTGHARQDGGRWSRTRRGTGAHDDELVPRASEPSP
ncbi:DNA-processing protein DprA [Actinotalea sp.]|uniref:DNA-processing protein DprA n=1 Tax=Actinotalea sp. TaxID=1872145 RepID=UPI0035653A72